MFAMFVIGWEAQSNLGGTRAGNRNWENQESIPGCVGWGLGVGVERFLLSPSRSEGCEDLNCGRTQLGGRGTHPLNRLLRLRRSLGALGSE